MLSIVVPSYKGHINEFKRFLESNKKYNLDFNFTIIYVVISYDEIGLFQPITSMFENVKILILKDLMLKYLEININESDFLNINGLYLFQSIKKLVGMLESEHELIFLTDSETQFIRNVNIIHEHEKTNTVLYSYKFDNCIQEHVSKLNNEILDIKHNTPFFGFTFSYQWCFKKEHIYEFFNKCKSKIIETIFKKPPFFFVEELIYKFCFYNNIYYKFENVTDLLSHTSQCEHFWLQATNSEKDRHIINTLLSFHNLFCYSVQNTWNDENNEKIIKDYKNFKILTSTPSTFLILD